MLRPSFASIQSMLSIELMKNIDVSTLGVSSLRALVTIHSLGSLGRAAEQLETSQSTLSHTLSRLRDAFGDELFLRQGRGIVPTERCNEIVAGLEPLLDQLSELARPPVFDPATTTETFTISCNFYERAVLLPGILRRFRSRAPRARLSIMQANLQGHEQLREGLCDLLISPLPSNVSGLYRRQLLTDTYACFVDDGHALAAEQLTIEDYQAAEHAAISYGGGWRPFYRSALDALGIEITPRVELPSFGAIGNILSGSDLVLTAPAALAQVMPPGVRKLNPPFQSSFDVFVFWSARQHQSEASQWLRRIVVSEAKAQTRAEI